MSFSMDEYHEWSDDWADGKPAGVPPQEEATARGAGRADGKWEWTEPAEVEHGLPEIGDLIYLDLGDGEVVCGLVMHTEGARWSAAVLEYPADLDHGDT